MNIRLAKVSVREALSFPGTMDIVFYKDENNRLYRLRYVNNMHCEDVIETLHRVMCASKYAPEIIDGEITMENLDEVYAKMGRDVYVLQKNAADFKFLDVTGKYEKTA